jgi:hypothetical protein
MGIADATGNARQAVSLRLLLLDQPIKIDPTLNIDRLHLSSHLGIS